MVREFFRDGIYRVSAHLAPEQAILQLADQLEPRIVPRDPQTDWRAWAMNPDHNALVLLEQPTLATLETLLRNANPQLRFLIETDDRTVLAPSLKQWVGNERVKEFNLPGYSAAEVARLVQTRDLTLTPESQTRLEDLRVSLQGDPVGLRAIVDLLASGGSLDSDQVIKSLVKTGTLPPISVSFSLPPDIIERPTLISDIHSHLQSTASPLAILHGPPGIGKRTVLAQLLRDPTLRLQFTDGFFLIRPAEDQQDASTLTEVQIESVLARAKQLPSRRADLADAFQQFLATQRLGLCLIDWLHPDSIRWLRQQMSPHSALIVTTSASAVTDGLDLPGQSVFHIPPFSPAETETYYRRRAALTQVPVTADDWVALQELHELT